MKVSIIVPVYNEEKVIANCLDSLARQDYNPREVIVVDDGSDDKTIANISQSVSLFRQDHQGSGAARNLGAKKSRGKILVFVDADMEFATDFVSKLIAPILAGKTVGTFSKEEYLLNQDSSLARCWNLNLGRDAQEMIPKNFPNKSPVFRAILKEEFRKVGGFDTKVGYTDDWSLSRKLGIKATAAPGARFYHRNPDNLVEVWQQARWYGKNEFLTRSAIRQLYNLLRYNPIFSVFKGVGGAVQFKEPSFFVFKIVYDTAVFTSVFLSFFGEQKYK